MSTPIAFNHTGGPLSVGIQCVTPQRMAYTFTLWEAGSNAVLLQQQGNNQNTQDDVYPLPDPVASNSGRLIQCDAVVYDDSGTGKPYQVDMIVYQNNLAIGTASATGTTIATSTLCSVLEQLQ